MLKLKLSAMMLSLLLLAASHTQCVAQAPVPPSALPLSSSPSVAYRMPAPLTFAQQQARFAAEQRTLRIQWNNWIGHSPLRPNRNASYMSTGSQRYYIPSRAAIVTSGRSNSWYW